MVDKAIIIVANQVGASLLPDNQQWKNRFEIRSESSNRLYTVAQRKSDNSWGCSCPGWKTRRNCKHLSSIVPLLASTEKKLQIKG
jgi:hypothetical protein